MDYAWCNGTAALCRCGRIGTWFYRDHKFTIEHNEAPTKVCRAKTLTAREERALRLARGRKRPY